MLIILGNVHHKEPTFDGFKTIDNFDLSKRFLKDRWISGLLVDFGVDSLVWIEMSDIGSGDEGISSQSTYLFTAV